MKRFSRGLLFLILFILAGPFLASAQGNDAPARLAYFEALDAYNSGRFGEAEASLLRAERLLGSRTARTAALAARIYAAAGKNAEAVTALEFYLTAAAAADPERGNLQELYSVLKAREKALQAELDSVDDAAWAAAKASGSSASYFEYLRMFPAGRNRAEANKLLSARERELASRFEASPGRAALDAYFSEFAWGPGAERIVSLILRTGRTALAEGNTEELYLASELGLDERLRNVDRDEAAGWRTRADYLTLYRRFLAEAVPGSPAVIMGDEEQAAVERENERRAAFGLSPLAVGIPADGAARTIYDTSLPVSERRTALYEFLSRYSPLETDPTYFDELAPPELNPGGIYWQAWVDFLEICLNGSSGMRNQALRYAHRAEEFMSDAEAELDWLRRALDFSRTTMAAGKPEAAAYAEPLAREAERYEASLDRSRRTAELRTLPPGFGFGFGLVLGPASSPLKLPEGESDPGGYSPAESGLDPFPTFGIAARYFVYTGGFGLSLGGNFLLGRSVSIADYLALPDGYNTAHGYPDSTGYSDSDYFTVERTETYFVEGSIQAFAGLELPVLKGVFLGPLAGVEILTTREYMVIMDKSTAEEVDYGWTSDRRLGLILGAVLRFIPQVTYTDNFIVNFNLDMTMPLRSPGELALAIAVNFNFIGHI